MFAVLTLASMACNDDPTEPAALRVDTLLTDLAHAQAMWISSGGVYFTETRDISHSVGDELRLSRYDLASRQVQLLIDRPQNARALVVTNPDRIYLAGFVGGSVSGSGRMSRAEPTAGVWAETHLLDVAIAANDMFLDGNGDIYLIGLSDQAGASNLYRLPAADYVGGATVIATGLGRSTAVTKVGADIYYSRVMANAGIRRIRGNLDEPILAGTNAIFSLTSDGASLYYTNYAGGYVGRINLATAASDTLLSGFTNPATIRYEPVSRRLFVISTDTTAGEFADGTLTVISNLP